MTNYSTAISSSLELFSNSSSVTSSSFVITSGYNSFTTSMIASSSSYNNSLLSCFCRYSFIKNSVTQSRMMLLIVVFAFSAPTLLKPADDGLWFCYRLTYIKHPLANHCEKTHQRLSSLVNSSVPYSIQSAHLSLSICLNGLLTWVSINWRNGVILLSIVLHCVLWRLKESTAYSKCDLTESMIKRDLTCWKNISAFFTTVPDRNEISWRSFSWCLPSCLQSPCL